MFVVVVDVLGMCCMSPYVCHVMLYMTRARVGTRNTCSDIAV